jgi:hypothetical protein
MHGLAELATDFARALGPSASAGAGWECRYCGQTVAYLTIQIEG